MEPSRQTLSKETIVRALRELNVHLERAQTQGEICLFGGTAMVLAFNARLSTKVLDYGQSGIVSPTKHLCLVKRIEPRLTPRPSRHAKSSEPRHKAHEIAAPS